ncbi:MAG: Holliday junction branch migration protein RuvA [Dictyoglomus sp. NZ13-RE01]|nr:MAG: Holliday junction branch migration protein RuvA [Dictyoglomus sp. NZ13-RE01]
MSFINHIHGKILEVDNNVLIISLNKISFRIFLSDCSIKKIKDKIGEEIDIYVSEIFNMESIRLYGFLEKDERDFFESLMELPGVGVRLALKIVDNITYNDWKNALENNNWEILTSIPGIGKKIAQKIFFSAKRTLPIEEKSDEIETVANALINLGYTKSEVNKVMKELSKEKGKSIEELIKIALDILRKM